MFARVIPPRRISFLGLDSPGQSGSGLVVAQGTAPPPPAASPATGGSSIGTWILVLAAAAGGYYAWTNREELFGIKPAPTPRRESPADYGADDYDDEGDDPEWEPGEREARVKQTVDDLVGGFMLDDGDVGMDNPPVLADVKRGLKAQGYKLKPKDWGYVAVRA